MFARPPGSDVGLSVVNPGEELYRNGLCHTPVLLLSPGSDDVPLLQSIRRERSMPSACEKSSQGTERQGETAGMGGRLNLGQVGEWSAPNRPKAE